MFACQQIPAAPGMPVIAARQRCPLQRCGDQRLQTPQPPVPEAASGLGQGGQGLPGNMPLVTEGDPLDDQPGLFRGQELLNQGAGKKIHWVSLAVFLFSTWISHLSY